MNFNHRTLLVTAMAIAFSFATPPPVAAASGESSDSEILAQILGQAREFEKAFLGNYSRRRASARILNGRTGELKWTRDQVVEVWDYHGEAPINEVRECKIDDKSVDLDECVEKRRLKPTHRLFNEDPVGDADEHYRYEYLGIDSWRAEASHRVRIVPLKNTTRHLKGDVYFLVDSLRFVGMQITLADYPFGLKDLSIKLNFADQNGLPVISGGESSVHIYVPFLINERTETVFSASDQRLLRERPLVSSASTGG